MNSTTSYAASAAARHDEATSLAHRVRRLATELLARYRAARAGRRMREELAQLPDEMLLDIGIAHDEIHRIRARDTFTPRVWLNSGIRG